MDFALQWHQRQLQETARAFLADWVSLELRRSAVTSDPGFSLEMHRAMGENGWLTVGVPIGSERADMVDLAVLYEEFGRAAAPGPHLISGLIAPLLIQALDKSHREEVDRLTAGRSIKTVALYEDREDGPESTRTFARRNNGTWTVDGEKAFVPYAASADSILVLARHGDGHGDLSFFDVPNGTPGLQISPVEVLSGERQYIVRLSDLHLGESAWLGNGTKVSMALRAIRPTVTVAQAAELVGISQRALDTAVQYAKDRVAFGHPIGSYQAIQHMCAEMLADVDASRFLVYQAACLVNSGEGADVRVAMAKAFSAAAARRVTKSAHQILAGAGFVLEHPLSFYYRRVKGIEATFGDVNDQLDLIADGLFNAADRAL
jgi:3-oxocholest-4-en-26-oyl-CoA dehydrogenase beta subunit